MRRCMMKIVITGGGTGGHLFPALIIAKELQNLGHEVYYFGNKRFIEREHVKKEGIPFIHIPSKSTLKKDVQFVLENGNGVIKAASKLKQINPNVVFSTGGFTTAPVLAAAYLLKIPFVLHEQNARIGLVNRLFRKKASSFIHSYPYQVKGHEVCIGNLSRYEETIQRISHFVTFMGGSGGAKFINELAIEYAEKHPSTEVLLLSGKNYEIKKTYQNLKVFPFVEDMINIYKMSDIVVARAGSTTLAELSALGVPSVVIPMPNSADNHQMKNAEYYQEKESVILIKQSDQTLEELEETLKKSTRQKKTILSHKIKACYNREAKNQIIQEIIQVAK